MILKEYTTENGETLKLPDEVSLSILETSNCVFKIKLFDVQGRNVENHGTNLDEMIQLAISDLLEMRK